MKNWLNFIQISLYPPTCFICDLATDNTIDLCHACQSDLHTIEQTCIICGIGLHADKSTCGRCLKKPPFFDEITSLFHYEGSAKFLIHSLKYKAKHSCARIMGELMAAHLKVANKQIDAIIAVPLHPKRMQERGFNQSDLIAEHINQQLELPDYSKCLTRIIDTANQTSLKASERKKNIKNAFHCNHLKALKL
jgi:ComF family protein